MKVIFIKTQILNVFFFTSTGRNNCLKAGYFPRLMLRDKYVERMQQSLGVSQLATFFLLCLFFLDFCHFRLQLL